MREGIGESLTSFHRGWTSLNGEFSPKSSHRFAESNFNLEFMRSPQSVISRGFEARRSPLRGHESALFTLALFERRSATLDTSWGRLTVAIIVIVRLAVIRGVGHLDIIVWLDIVIHVLGGTARCPRNHTFRKRQRVGVDLRIRVLFLLFIVLLSSVMALSRCL
jgi:hypothetical protein